MNSSFKRRSRELSPSPLATTRQYRVCRGIGSGCQAGLPAVREDVSQMIPVPDAESIEMSEDIPGWSS